MSFKVTLKPSGHQFEVEAGARILDAGIAAGYAMPYSCRAGTCSTCRGKIVEGKVDYGFTTPHYLTPEHRAAGLALLCSASPLSDLVIEVEEVSSIGVKPTTVTPPATGGPTARARGRRQRGRGAMRLSGVAAYSESSSSESSLLSSPFFFAFFPFLGLAPLPFSPPLPFSSSPLSSTQKAPFGTVKSSSEKFSWPGAHARPSNAPPTDQRRRIHAPGAPMPSKTASASASTKSSSSLPSLKAVHVRTPG